MNTDELLAIHTELCEYAHALMKRKNHDYAGQDGETPFANFTRCEAMGITTTERGFLVRMTDKMSRLSTFADAGELLVKDEGVEDTAVDVINYMVLFIAFLRQKRATEPVAPGSPGLSPGLSPSTKDAPEPTRPGPGEVIPVRRIAKKDQATCLTGCSQFLHVYCCPNVRPDDVWIIGDDGAIEAK